MAKRTQTTVNLTRNALKIKNRYAPLGLKEILSVGLELFNKLSDTEKIEWISKVVAEDKAAKIVAAADAQAASARRKQNKNPRQTESA